MTENYKHIYMIFLLYRFASIKLGKNTRHNEYYSHNYIKIKNILKVKYNFQIIKHKLIFKYITS